MASRKVVVIKHGILGKGSGSVGQVEQTKDNVIRSGKNTSKGKTKPRN